MNNQQLFVPYGLNFKTSFLFLLPLCYSYYNNLLDIALGCNICLITSLLNHATYIKIINTIDKLTNSVCLLYFSIYYYTNNIYYYLTLCCIFIVIYTIKISKLSYHLQYGIYIHSLIHLIGNIGIIFLIKSHISD
jgi:hypothetical protein